ncbi:MAG: lactate utilization protein [Bacillota bacterium]|nr:lactate utilization protein [Bacillota bacterium]
MNIEKTIENLEKNNMQAFFVKDKKAALEKVKQLLNKGETVAVGGSVTLNETEVLSLLKSGDYNFLDRYKEGLTPDEIDDIFRKSFFADTFLSGTNAITENGELYNVDGNANRIAAILFGPKSVIIVAGINKIVPDLSHAVERVKEIAAPKNCKRLNKNTYCSKEGKCLKASYQAEGMCMGCGSADRICCDYAICSYQRIKGRIKVIIVDEPLGF